VRLPRLEAIRLDYGCHSGRFQLPDEGRPVVIAGRNGSGKTTLLEAFVRTLYGFSKRKPEERRLLELRRPWSGRPAEAELELVAADGTAIAVHRDFATDQVVARARASGEELFRGDANPAGVRSESRHYQDLVREWVGFATLEPYRATAWIAQGELVDTRLDDELLRAAAGSHRRVETALNELRDSFDELTRESIELGGRRKNRSREIENLREETEAVVDRLEAARTARERRKPLLEQEAQTRAEMNRVEVEIGLLESSYRPITERRTLIAEEKEASSHLSSLSESIRWLREARTGLERASMELAAAEAAGQYPADFETRLGQAETLWERLRVLNGESGTTPAPDSEPPDRPVMALAGAALGLLGLGIGLTISSTAGWILGSAGLALIGAYAWRQHSVKREAEERAHDLSVSREADLAAVKSKLASVVAGFPQPGLSPETRVVHQERFRKQADARTALRLAEQTERQSTERARALVRIEAAGAEEASTAAVVQHLEAAEGEARTALARIQLRAEEQPATPELPAGVEESVPAIEAAREERRERRDALRARQADLDLELRDLKRMAEDVFALERELAGLRDRIRETEAEAQVGRLAWELVRDAYEEFRATDQGRLLGAVNERLDALSRGRLGPVETKGDLASSRVGLLGRPVPLESPPLSFGENHIVLLAIRLGTADFLSREGLHHPLLVDEPFTHLDEAHSRDVWDLLSKLATERQVVVTTQNRLVLEHLGVEPDVDLPLPEPATEQSGRVL
jgi:DNA repair exonuclease SbcCD ATPase subunit